MESDFINDYVNELKDLLSDFDKPPQFIIQANHATPCKQGVAYRCLKFIR